MVKTSMRKVAICKCLNFPPEQIESCFGPYDAYKISSPLSSI